MARITVEDCIDKVDSPYELVMVAKERAVQLNSGVIPSVEPDNDKNTVISLREIAEEKILVKDLESEAIYKLRKHVEQIEDTNNEDEIVGDDFENLYKGEASKSGVPILPSKRARKIPEKIQTISKEEIDTSEKIQTISKEEIDTSENKVSEIVLENEDQVSLEDLKEQESLEDEIVEEENKN